MRVRAARPEAAGETANHLGPAICLYDLEPTYRFGRKIRQAEAQLRLFHFPESWTGCKPRCHHVRIAAKSHMGSYMTSALAP